MSASRPRRARISGTASTSFKAIRPYQDAYHQFRLAYEASKSWKVLGNLGLCVLKLERDREALEFYQEYLRRGGKEIVRGFEFDLDICNDMGNVPVTGKVMTVWFYVDGPAIPASTYLSPYIYANYNGMGQGPFSPVGGQWFSVALPADTFEGNVYRIGVTGYINGTEDWDGTVYIDDITFK